MIGPFVLDFLNHLEKAFPQSWRRSIQGVLSLGQSFDPEVLNKACERAIVFGAISYRSVKRICETGLYASSDVGICTNVAGKIAREWRVGSVPFF